MYNHLRGTITLIRPTRIVLETGGIGWDVTVPLSTSQRAPGAGQEATLLIHLAVREDAMQLYGFLTEDERMLFRTLIGLKGVGCATAVQILSSTTPEEFLLAIERQDAGFLKKIKGIGEKSAKRLILELKGAKTLLPAGEDAPALAGVPGDAAAALQAMGLSEREAVDRVEKTLAQTPDLSLEDLIKAALRG